jgi:HAL2 family 3'(2'),5'-bisphosphate nucleotidase
MADYARFAQAALDAVRDACLVCRTVQKNMDGVRAITKDDSSPVTIADYASQAVVAHTLRSRLEGRLHLVGEETSAYLRNPEHRAALVGAVEAAHEVWPEADEQRFLEAVDVGAGDPHPGGFWTLDPVDGTKGFIRGHQYSVCLAYIEHGQVIIGVLGCPNLARDFSVEFDERDPAGSIYWCVRGQGVWELACTHGGSEKPVHIQRLPHASPTISYCESVDSSHTYREAVEGVMNAVGASGEPSRLDGQGKYAVVARGQVDAHTRLPRKRPYVERIWDHAPGALIASEAGCSVTDARGDPLDFGHGRGLERNVGIVVAPPALHGRIVAEIAKRQLL